MSPKKKAKKKTAGKTKTKSKRGTKSNSKTRSKANTSAKAKAKRKAQARAKAKAKPKQKSAGNAIKVTPALKRRALSILDGLKQQHPDAHCELDFSNGLELLVATILAAQCTDKRVNMVTKDLFKKYRTAQDYVDVPADVFEEEIRSTGFYRNKTKSIKKAAESLVERFGGKMPETMDELLELAGVGRKSANVLLANVFDKPGIVVDTHMLRISKRMGFTTNTDPVKVEFDLQEIFPEGEWISLSHLIPWHGRRVCSARKPLCDECGGAHACPKLL